MERREYGSVVWNGFPELELQGAFTTAISTRHGGMSRGDLGSLNLSLSVSDDPANVVENSKRFVQAIDAADVALVSSRQVHGSAVACVDQPISSASRLSVGDADGMLSTQSNVALTMNFADCVPILLVDPSRQVIGLAHAGWKGTLANVASVIVSTAEQRYGSRPSDLLIAIGPSIGPCCYEVGSELIDRARSLWTWGPDVVDSINQRNRLNLWEANRRQLIEAGCNCDRIFLSGVCTKCNNSEYFSHRGQQGRAGRFAALIVRRSCTLGQ